MSASPRVKVAVVGANGRMGRAVTRLARAAGMDVVCALGAGDEGKDAGELAGIGAIGVRLTSDPSALAASGASVAIDFSSPVAMMAVAQACEDAGIALVSGTTGLDAEAMASLESAEKKVAVMWEPNWSVGVHVLATLIEKALAALGPSFDVEVMEVHHRHKVDAPSGTAIRLGDVVKRARSGSGYVHGREGRPGARQPTEIGMHALRGGDVIGDHTVFLFGDGERLELTHRASSRDLFAHGAVRAAAWLVGKPAGRHRLAAMLETAP